MNNIINTGDQYVSIEEETFGNVFKVMSKYTRSKITRDKPRYDIELTGLNEIGTYYKKQLKLEEFYEKFLTEKEFIRKIKIEKLKQLIK